MFTICVINMNDGSEHASAAPARARRTLKVAKLLHAAWSIKKKPHMKILCDHMEISLHFDAYLSGKRKISEEGNKTYLKPTYFPSGSLCMRKLVGNAQARKPK